MSNIHDYPSPILGVSTLAPRNRSEGQATLQENMRSDPVSKLTRRPPIKWVSRLLAAATPGSFTVHSYRRNDKDFLILVDDDGVVTAFADDVSKTVTGNLAAYVGLAANLRLNNINDTTFVVDTKKQVLMTAATDEDSVEGVAHLNIISAMNYGETMSVDVKQQGGTVTTVTHTIPDLGISTTPDFDSADKARATKKVAEELATKLDALSGISALAKSSAVAVWEDAFPNDFLHVQVQTGQGDRSAVAFNQELQSTSGLPLYAVYGTTIKIKPDPSSTRGQFYLTAVATDPTGVIASSPATRIMQEVTWVETRAPDEPYAFDATTMPHTIVYNSDTDDFTVGIPSVGWNDREVGDNKTVRVPTFVNATIDNLNYMQKRLALLSDNSVVMSKTDDLFDFWKASANRLVKSDPIDVASSAAGTDSLKNMIPHNKDLLVLASNAQFKISGKEAITPETVSMPLTTSFECQTIVEPVLMGNSVFFPTQYGESTGIHEYTAEKETSQDSGFQITHHIIGYMPGTVTALAASPNLELLVVTTTGGAANELFVYEQFTLQETKTQLAWSKWILPSGNDIQHMILTGDKLDLLVVENGALFLKRLEMYSTINTNSQSTVFTDDQVELTSTDGLTVTLPTNYLYNADMIVLVKTGEAPLAKVQYTHNAGVLTFTEDIREGTTPAVVYVGRPFSSRYKPTRPFLYSEDGVADTHDRLRIKRFILSVVDAHELSMKITSDFSEDKIITQVARTVGLAKLGEIPFVTTNWLFSFRNKADLAEAEFFTDEPYAVTIAGIAWEGQLYRSKKRI